MSILFAPLIGILIYILFVILSILTYFFIKKYLIIRLIEKYEGYPSYYVKIKNIDELNTLAKGFLSYIVLVEDKPELVYIWHAKSKRYSIIVPKSSLNWY